jgi:glycerate kinase
MPLRVLIVPDKFKGTLSALDAARAIAKGWRTARPHDALELLPMSDGGDGFGAIVSGLIGAEEQSVKTVDAARSPCDTTWWWEPRKRLAIIESARVIGLAMLPPGKYHPFELDTTGLGKVILAAQAKGATRCLLGIGGSATNDGGFGMAKALGWQFLDPLGNQIDCWTGLRDLDHIVKPGRGRMFKELTVAVDVQNPLLGAQGATRVYGPQKGVLPQQYRKAEGCLERLSQVTTKTLGADCASLPGAGAAGGLGFGLFAFAGGRPAPGFDLFARYAALNQRLAKADLVITGEGSVDRSTLMGKGVGRVAERCGKLGVPCIALAGVITPETRKSSLFAESKALADLCPPAEAKSHAPRWLEKLAAETASHRP